MASENLLFLVYKPKNYTYDVSWRKEFNLFMCIVNTLRKLVACAAFCAQLPTGTGGSLLF